MNPLPESLVQRLRAVRSVGAITGAGVSQESGIKTYRGQDGLYDDPAEGDRTVEALSAPTLRSDPDRTWQALAALAQQARGAEPNPAHRALARIERNVERFALLTQNVDGLHRTAGSQNLIEIHGNITATVCTACRKRGALTHGEIAGITRTPRCDCGGRVRPDVVLFGELLPAKKVARMQREFYTQVPDLVIVAGTTALFPYIAEPAFHAQASGKLTVEINPEATPISNIVDVHLQGPAGHYLPLIANVLV